MASKNAPRDKNFVPAALFEIDGSNGDVYPGQIDQATGRILVDASGASVAAALQTDIFTSTNLQTTFTPSKTPVATIYLSINGSIQTPSTDYSFTGGNYVLSNGIPSGNSVVVCYATS